MKQNIMLLVLITTMALVNLNAEPRAQFKEVGFEDIQTVPGEELQVITDEEAIPVAQPLAQPQIAQPQKEIAVSSVKDETQEVKSPEKSVKTNREEEKKELEPSKISVEPITEHHAARPIESSAKKAEKEKVVATEAPAPAPAEKKEAAPIIDEEHKIGLIDKIKTWFSDLFSKKEEYKELPQAEPEAQSPDGPK
jgi:hypothetical protein